MTIMELLNLKLMEEHSHTTQYMLVELFLIQLMIQLLLMVYPMEMILCMLLMQMDVQRLIL